MALLWEALCAGYDRLGLDEATGGDEVFRQLVLARIIEPTSKQDSLRVLAEAGIDAVSYATVKRRLQGYADDAWRYRLAAACAAHAQLRPASMVLYDVSTLYFETDAGDGFREPGFSKERRLDPQITIGLLTDASGFPLMVEAFEGNRAETTTIAPDHPRVHARPPTPRRDGRGGRGHGVRHQQARDRGSRAVVHPRRTPARHPLRRGPMAA
jgi:hypothetical protein